MGRREGWAGVWCVGAGGWVQHGWGVRGGERGEDVGWGRGGAWEIGRAHV